MDIKKSGKTKQHIQRYQCRQCKKTFVWKEPHVKKYNEQQWFKLWVQESYSIRQLSCISGHSEFKLKQIKNYWLKRLPEEQFCYSQYKYIIYDGTYFHKDGCLINLMNAQDQKIISHTYIQKENFKDLYPWFLKLRIKGLAPDYITVDGERSVIRAMKMVWPQVRIQRCLYHIQHEGMRWLRTYPKTRAGRDLRFLLAKLCCIKSFKERDDFINSFHLWLKKHQSFVLSLPKVDIAFKDLKRTIGLIKNAIPDMFYYLRDQDIHSTTNALESFHSRLKADYRRHRGLTEQHRIQYLSWYCYFKNGLI